jgi:hypothetical protein
VGAVPHPVRSSTQTGTTPCCIPLTFKSHIVRVATAEAAGIVVENGLIVLFAQRNSLVKNFPASCRGAE